MPTLASELRNKLERVVIEARDAAEVGARAALEALAVHHHEPYPHMTPAQRQLRNHLRARARQLGDKQDTSGRLAIDHLAGECAYEHWHRMLFARFLAENNLLIEPEHKMPINLAEAEELAKEQVQDVWTYASHCAQDMLPQIFRPDDPLLHVTFATEHRIKLEQLLASLPPAVFTASDALGWVYQFWQSNKKKQVNESEVKIGADEISAVTQLFTEPYMVEFLLHNTLGAWWAGKKLTTEDAESAESEDELRKKVALPGIRWDYLRFVRGAEGKGGPWRPAAGTFDGWPKAARDIKVLDPCCGSGHFLVAALHHLVPIRMAEEGLSAAEAIDAVLRDNLHGLEIDERCCQIAAFALAFAAWTYPEAGGYRELPELNIACTGIGPQCSAEQWIKLAEQSGIPMPAVGREAIKNGLLNLHRLFSQAPTLGSLINPKELPGDLIAADYETIQPYLAAILQAETADDETRQRAIAAAGMAKAADLLAGEYTLVITNPPYLGRGLQGTIIRQFGDRFAPEAKNNLATLFLVRAEGVLVTGGTLAFVTPQEWLFLPRFRACRKRAFSQFLWHFAVRLGENAFESPQAAGAFAALVCYSMGRPTSKHRLAGIDAAAHRNEPPILPPDKARILQGRVTAAEDGRRKCSMLSQSSQLTNPDSRLVLTEMEESPLLSQVAFSRTGTRTADNQSLLPCFWEAAEQGTTWRLVQSTVCNTVEWGGCEHALRWDEGQGRLHELNGLGLASIQGEDAWGRPGIVVSLTGTLSVSLYTGVPFDMNAGVVCPKRPSDLPALWAYLSSPRYHDDVRAIDQQLKLTTATLLKVPFDLGEWTAMAAEKYPDGLPEPESDDPTQWLFHGWPGINEPAAGMPPLQPLAPDDARRAMLQVAVARLLGYRWPAETEELTAEGAEGHRGEPEYDVSSPRSSASSAVKSPMRLSKRARELVERCKELLPFADNDGIVCIPAVRGEEPAAERLLKLLAACGIELESGFDLDDWLRNSFFEEHCRLFHDRPFIWHIWDGRKRDGFHALVNYHKLAEGGGKGRRLLENLTYAYLGDWITRQRDGVKRGEGGAEDRLAAALELQKRLEAILAGEPPFDIFVRWKPLAEQPIGWEPDINDGVRLNIRPFLASDLPNGRKGAGILRYRPNIKWTKDRGKEPQRDKADYPWFWGWDEKTVDFLGGKEFDGNRWNDCHYTNKVKQAARDAAKEEDRR